MIVHTDPVCGMPTPEERATVLDRDGARFWFCSEFCKQQFLRQSLAYVSTEAPAPTTVHWPSRRVAYFSMEVALDDNMPTFSGGLGVLAGDTLRSCADLEIPVVAVSLVHRRGYFHQEIRDDWQFEHDAPWSPDSTLQEVNVRVSVTIEDRAVQLRAWRYDVVGASGHVVPLLFLDTDLDENHIDDRSITDRLYGGDQRYRLMQEIVLGIGGIRLLHAIGCTGLQTFHLNEGHAALAPLELLRAQGSATGWQFQQVRNRTVFTTHTPVPAGHDRFDRALVDRTLRDFVPRQVLDMLSGADSLNMTHVALNLSHYVNGVALRHREVSSELFPLYEIHQITNGVHARTWTSDAFKVLFDRYIPGWRTDPLMLHNALALPRGDVWDAHHGAKLALLDQVVKRTGRRLRADALTLGFARRATAYKRSDLILSDLSALRAISAKYPLQIVFAGKAHPKDDPGKRGIQAILKALHALGDDVPVVFLPDYNLELAGGLVAGVDVWLNTPLPPLEASGTSGMKAALNGVPSFSVLDGWWREGWIEGATGWAIGAADRTDDAVADDGRHLYHKLESIIAPLFYENRDRWIDVMRQSIALNGSFFNTHRMVRQYALHAYSLGVDQ